MTGTIQLISAQIVRDLRLAFRGGGGWFHALFFFIVFASFGGFAIGPERNDLVAAAPALVWLGVLISLLVSATDLFRPDMEDGSIAVIAAERNSLAPYVIARLVAVGATILLPMILMAPLFYLFFGLNPAESVKAATFLLLAGPALLLSCVVSAALSAGMRTGGLLGASLSAPLAIPILIFGIGATQRLLEGGGLLSAEILFLLAISLFYAVILPPFAILSIRLGLE